MTYKFSQRQSDVAQDEMTKWTVQLLYRNCASPGPSSLSRIALRSKGCEFEKLSVYCVNKKAS